MHMFFRMAGITLLLFTHEVWAQVGKPVITGQADVGTEEDKPLTLQMTDLTVWDWNNPFYPWGFTMTIHEGEHYTASGHVITLEANFNGTLDVPVTVNDGQYDSDPHVVHITVIPVNDAPVITGQRPLTTPGTPITLTLADLQVTDVDNPYPTGFTLMVSTGSQYTVSGSTITPAKGFHGSLRVPVTVSDGQRNSAPYTITIAVLAELSITGPATRTTDEDVALRLALTDLTVYDPTQTYPEGYTLTITAGDHYSVGEQLIIPEPNFNGTLRVNLTISKGNTTSRPYVLVVTVKPVNDAPQLDMLETNDLVVTVGDGPAHLTLQAVVKDIDQDRIALAEVGFFSDNYRPGEDVLIFSRSAHINTVFDERTGVLALIGLAPVAEYQQVLRNIQYQYSNEDDPRPENKILYIKLNDGQSVSQTYTRRIVLQEDMSLDIPNAFTPNNDQANDTWMIRAHRAQDRFGQASVKVFNKRGALVFESTGIDVPWDGSSHGAPLPADTYYYVIRLELTYVRQDYRGTVTILR